MEKQKVIEKATKCLDAIKMGHGHYQPGRFVELADKIYEEWEDFYATVVMMAKESEREWIPCSERLPECGQAVLVALDGGSMTDGVRSADHAGRSVWDCALDNRTWYGDENIVIAWMPLPEPAKLESE